GRRARRPRTRRRRGGGSRGGNGTRERASGIALFETRGRLLLHPLAIGPEGGGDLRIGHAELHDSPRAVLLAGSVLNFPFVQFICLERDGACCGIPFDVTGAVGDVLQMNERVPLWVFAILVLRPTDSTRDGSWVKFI